MPCNDLQAIKKPAEGNFDRPLLCTYIIASPRRFQQPGTENQINDTPRNHGQRSALATNGIRSSPHQRRNHGTTENSGNHQTRNFICFVRASAQGNRIENRKNARAGKSNQTDKRQDCHHSLHKKKSDHSGKRQQDIDPVITDIRQPRQQNRPDQSSGSPAKEIDARTVSGILHGKATAFDQ